MDDDAKMIAELHEGKLLCDTAIAALDALSYHMFLHGRTRGKALVNSNFLRGIRVDYEDDIERIREGSE